MSRTHRKYHNFFYKEDKMNRKWWRKRNRLVNKSNLRKGREIERYDRTEGWLTW